MSFNVSNYEKVKKKKCFCGSFNLRGVKKMVLFHLNFLFQLIREIIN